MTVRAPQGNPPGRGSLADFGVGLALFVAGLAYGMWAVWLVPVRLWGGLEGLTLVVTAVGNVAVGTLAAWSLRAPRAVLCPVLGWLVATGAMALVVGPGGDIVVPGGLPYDPGVPTVGAVNWLVGLLSAVAAFAVGSAAAGGRFTRRGRAPRQLG